MLEVKVGPHGYEHNWVFVGVPGVGHSVRHPVHGKGIVTAADGKHVTVNFHSGTAKTFEHTAPKPGKPSGFVTRGEHDASHAAASPHAAHAAEARRIAGTLRGTPADLPTGGHGDGEKFSGTLERAAAHFDAANLAEGRRAVGEAGSSMEHRHKLLSTEARQADEEAASTRGTAHSADWKARADAAREPLGKLDESVGGARGLMRASKPAAAVSSAGTPGSGGRTRDEAIAHAKQVREADKAGGGTLPPLAVTRAAAKQADGSHVMHAVDHEGREYAVRLGTDRNVTVTHDGRSLAGPAGSSATDTARELAGKLTAAPAAPPRAARPAEPDLPEPAADVHARQANSIASVVRSDLPDEPHSRAAAASLWTASGHMKAGNHDDAVNYLRAAEIHLGRAGGTSPQAEKLQQNVARLRADHTAATGARGKVDEAAAEAARLRAGTPAAATPAVAVKPVEAAKPEPGSGVHARRANELATAVRRDLSDGVSSRSAATALETAAGHMTAGRDEDAASHLGAAGIHLHEAAGKNARAGTLERHVTKLRADHARTTGAGGNADEANAEAERLRGIAAPEPPRAAEPAADGFWADQSGAPEPEPAKPAPKPQWGQGGMFAEPDKLGTGAMFGDQFGTGDITAPNADAVAPAVPAGPDGHLAGRISDTADGIEGEGRGEADVRNHLLDASEALRNGDRASARSHMGDAHDAAVRLDTSNGRPRPKGDSVQMPERWPSGPVADQVAPLRHQLEDLSAAQPPAPAPPAPVKWEHANTYTGGNYFGTVNGHGVSVSHGKSGAPYTASVGGQAVGQHDDLGAAQQMAADRARALPAAPPRKAYEPTATEKQSTEMGALLPKLADSAGDDDKSPYWDAHDAVMQARAHLDEGRPGQAAQSLHDAWAGSGKHTQAIGDLRARVQLEAAHPGQSEKPDTPLLGSIPNGDNAEYQRMSGRTAVITPDYRGGTGYEARIDGQMFARTQTLPKMHQALNRQAAKFTRAESKGDSTAREVKDLASLIASSTGREDAVRAHLGTAAAALDDGDAKTAFGALDLARRHAAGEFGAHPDWPVQLADRSEAARAIMLVRDEVRAAALQVP